MCSLIGSAVDLVFSIRLSAVAFLPSTESPGFLSWRYSPSAVGVCLLAGVTPGGTRTPLEVQKRKAVIPLLYIMSFLWLAQIVFAVYGTAVVHHVAPGCWMGSEARAVVHVAQGMTYSTWAFTALLILCLSAIYNAYPEHNKQENWERRCLCVSWLCGCAQDMQRKVEGRGAPLPSIAQWISGLFGSVDLAPSDITAALVLAAAAQRRRRRNRIKRALNPILKAASNAPSYQTSDHLSETTASADDRSDLEDDESTLEDIPEGQEDVEAPPAKRQQRDAGQLDAHSNGQSAVAMPAGYPEEWKKKFEEGYQQAAQAMPQVSAEEGRSGRLTSKADPPPDRGNDESTADALPHADTHELGGVPAQHVSHDEAVVDAQLERQRLKQTSTGASLSAGQDGVLDDSVPEPAHMSPFAAPGLGPELAPNPAVIVSLSQLDPETLEDVRGAEAVLVGFQRAESQGSEHDYVTVGPDGVPTAGLMQAGMNEPSGTLGAPSELSLQHTTYSGKLLDDHGVPIADTRNQDLQQVAGTDLVGPDSKPTEQMDSAASMAVPLERQISFKFPTVITPSEQAEDVRHIQTGEDGVTEQVLTAKQAATAYAGSFNAVDLADLEIASHFVKYAVASYAIIPVTENPDKNRFQRSPLTCGACAKKNVVSGDSITADILKLADLEPDELLYWSHDNRALSHLPYMIILDKEKKKVVVAIRGTQSIADLVTDAVVHPEPMDSWVPQDFLKKNGPLGAVFGHAGMVSSAEAILKDMEEHGVLQTLLQGEEYKGQENENTGEGVGAKMAKALDGKNYQLVITGHSLGAGTAALVGLKLKARFPDVRTWAFNPPGGLVTRNLNKVLDTFCTSLVVGKDAVSRGTVNNLSRLMDEMVTALARCRYHKLHVIMGGWWWKERRPAPDSLFCPYSKIPRESRALLERYHLAQERKGRALNMYPPGRIIFLRPIKVRKKRKHGGEGKLVKRWDAVWVSPREVVGEGILVSKRMLEDHLSEKALIPALRFVAENHPQRLARSDSKQQQKADEADKFEDNLHEIVVDGLDQRTRATGLGSSPERQMS
ncbi:hypothetical protein ABBQ38_004792 [Trebouxia sp. C0009 RCD-2024]